MVRRKQSWRVCGLEEGQCFLAEERKSLLASAGIAGLLFAGCCAQAATYIQVPPVPGSVSMIAFDITNNNTVIGSYHDSAGVEHGFIGPLDGSNYKTIDFGGNAIGTEPRGIGYDGAIVGFAPTSGFILGQEFYRKPNGQFLTFKKHGAPLDGVVQGINGFGTSVGDYYNADGIRMGYFGVTGSYKRDFDLRIDGYLQNSPRGLSHDRGIDGYFIDSDGAEHGFIQYNGNVQVIDYPDNGAVLTVLEAFNNAGEGPGQWNDTAGNPHAFVLHTRNNTFTTLDPGDGSTFQQAWGENAYGLVTLSTSNGTSYVYCPFNDANKCPKGGAVKHVPDRNIHVASGTFLHYDRQGRTGKHLPNVNKLSRKGAVQ